MPRSHDTSAPRRGRLTAPGGRGRPASGVHSGPVGLAHSREHATLDALVAASDCRRVDAERILGIVGLYAYPRVDNPKVLCDDVGPAAP